MAGAELAAVAVALVAVPALDNRSSVDSIDPTAILAAVAFVVAATVAVVVPVVLALRIAGRAARWTAPSAVLAARRLYTDPIPTAAAVAVAAVCVGLFSYGTVLQSSARRTIEAKAGVFAGGQVSVVVPEMHEVPHDLTGRATSVRLIAQATTVVGAVDVLAVDPRTFSNGAFWDDDFSHRSLPDLMHDIARRGPGGAVPVLAVGRVPSRFTVDDLDLDVAVVERPHAFPGLRSRPLLVVDQRNVHAEGGERLLWANASLDTVARALRGSGLVARRPITVDRVFDAPAFYTLDWSFGFLRGTAAWAALIGAIAFLVHLDLRRRRSMAAEVVLVTMGMARSRQAASRVAEVGLALVTGCGLGIALALVAASRSHRTVDLTPYVPPASILDVPAARLALVAAGVTAALPVFAALVYASRPGKPAEVLRSELV